MRAVEIGLASQPSVASDFACSIMASRAAASFLPRSAKAALRPPSTSRFTSSVRVGSEASPSPVIERSTS
jgi:hypothetical protein